jgi:hypothetical protein
MYHLTRRTVLASAALALIMLSSNAGAQAIYGAAEFDDDEFAMLFLGGSISSSGLGWKPYVAVSAFSLRFPSGTGTLNRNVVAPFIGLVNRTNVGSVGFGVGYAFADEDVGGPLLVAESGDGVVGTFQWNHWGAGDHALQFLGSYNFGTEFLWTRGRASRPLATESPLWVGGEAALFGGGDPSAWLGQFGPTIEWRFSPQFRLGGSAGLKFGLSNGGGSSAYGRLEFLWLPRAR